MHHCEVCCAPLHALLIIHHKQDTSACAHLQALRVAQS